MSPVVRSFIRRSARGSSGTMKKIGGDIVRSIPFPTGLSPVQQEATATRVRSALTVTLRGSSTAMRQLDTIKALPGALLREVFGNFTLLRS